MVRLVPTPAATLVRISGEVDIATVTKLSGRLDALPDRDTVVDLCEVGLLSATGVTVLLTLHDRLAAAGARLMLAAASRPVRRVLSVTGLDAHLVLAPSLDDALTLL